jgi:hypothetical protein
MVALSVRRWRAQSKLFALVLAVAVVAGTVLSGSLLLVRSAEQAGIRDALSSMTPDRVDVDVRMTNPANPVSATRESIDVAVTDAYGRGLDWSSAAWLTSAWGQTPDGVYSYLVELDDPSAAATLTSGVWPTSAPGIALPDSAATSLGLALGDTLTLDSNGSPVQFTVQGLYQALPESGIFWENDPLLATGNIDEFPEPDRSFYSPAHGAGPLIVAPGGVDASGLSTGQLHVTAHPAFLRPDAATLAALQARIPDAELDVARAVSQAGSEIFVDTDMGQALADVDAGLAASRSVALIIALVLLVVVVGAAAAVTRLLGEARRAEFDLLRARGASHGQVALAVVIDALAVAALIAVLSPWGAVVLHAGIVAVPPLNSAGVQQWVLPDATTWVASTVVALLVGALLCLPSAPSRGMFGKLPAGAVTVAAQTVLLVIAGLMIWRVTSAETRQGDILLTATPAVLLIAFAIVGSRVVTAATRLIGTLSSRSRGAVAPLAGWFASRAPGRSTGVALLALTVGASVVVLGANATWLQAVQNNAAVAVGPPARIAADNAGTIVADGLAQAGGSPVIRRQAFVVKELLGGSVDSAPGASVQVLGVGPAGRAQLSGGAVGEAGGTAIAGELPPRAIADSGPALPPGTTTVRATITIDAPEGVETVASLVTADESGLLAVLPLGPIEAGVATDVSAELATPVTAGNPTRLVGVTIQVRDEAGANPSGGGDVVRVLTTVDGLLAGGDQPDVGAPLAVLEDDFWVGSVSTDAERPPEVVVAGTGVRLEAYAVLGPAPITFGAVGWNAGSTVGAVIPTTLADDLDVGSDTILAGNIGGALVRFRMVGDATAIPGSATADDLRALAAGLPSDSRAASTILVDGQALAHSLVESSASGPLINEIWISGDGLNIVHNGDPSVDAVTATHLGEQMMDAPLRAEIPASAAVAVAASVLLALAGFGARTAAVSRSRRLESAQLRAVGLSRRGMLAVASIDTVVIAAAGIVVGIVGGVATLLLVGTRIVSVGGASASELVVPWQAVVLLPLALLAAVAVIAVGISWGQRRLPLAELLRTGADG